MMNEQQAAAILESTRKLQEQNQILLQQLISVAEMQRKANDDRAELMDKLESMQSGVWGGADPEKPSLVMRLDRVERQIATGQRVIQWIGGGGLVGVAASVAILYQIAQSLIHKP